MTASTSAGTTFGLSAAAPATYDPTGFAALTFTLVGGIEKLGGFGAETEVINFQPLSGPKEKHKGPVDYKQLTPTLAHDKADAGQTLLRTACEPDNNALYSTCVTFSNGDKRYSQGRAFSYVETVDGASSLIMASPVIELSKKVIKVDAP